MSLIKKAKKELVKSQKLKQSYEVKINENKQELKRLEARGSYFNKELNLVSSDIEAQKLVKFSPDDNRLKLRSHYVAELSSIKLRLEKTERLLKDLASQKIVISNRIKNLSAELKKMREVQKTGGLASIFVTKE